MRRNATPSKGSGAGRGNRLRLALLLATAAAFLLVPVAQAAAENTLKVNLAGAGSGTVSSVGGNAGEHEGTPPINCSGPPATGTCESTMGGLGGPEEEFFEEEFGIRAIWLKIAANPGSEVAGVTLEKGFTFGPISGCIPSAKACLAYGTEGGDAELTITFQPKPTLTVTKEGTGSGTVVSSPAGIECGATCSADFKENTKVTLTASPSAGSLFVSWKGCEKGGVNGRQCTVTMDKAKTVNAKFIAAYDVTVNRVGSGLGKVSSSPGGVLCLSNCSSTTAAFKEGTSVTLNAAPTKNFVFTEWTGDCSGSGPCSLGTLGEDKEVGAKFTEVAKHLLTVNKSGGGQGTAKSNLAGINCGATCSSMASAYYQDVEVELTAIPGKGSAFGQWSAGSGCGVATTCVVKMSEAKEISAFFK